MKKEGASVGVQKIGFVENRTESHRKTKFETKHLYRTLCDSRFFFNRESPFYENCTAESYMLLVFLPGIAFY